MKWSSVAIALLVMFLVVGSLIPSSQAVFKISKPTYQKRRFGLGYTELFGLHDEFLTWYTTTKPYYSAFKLHIDTVTIVEKRERYRFLRDYIIPEFNRLDIALCLKISSSNYDDTSEREQVINIFKEEIGSQHCLKVGFFSHDWEFATRADGSLFYENKPPVSEFKTYWYDWWWDELKTIDSNYVYAIDHIYTPDVLDRLEEDGTPWFLYYRGNVSPATDEGIDAWIGIDYSELNFLGAGHSCWQYESKDDWENPDWGEYGDYWINLNFEAYDSKAGTGSEGAQRMPFLFHNIEVNVYPWNPVGRDPYKYDPNFENLMQNIWYVNIVSRLDTYMMNLNSGEARALTITTSPGGTTDPPPGIHAYNEGTNVPVTAIPDADYIFENWELDESDVGNANPYTVLMDGNHTIRAIFSLKPKSTITGTVTDSTTGTPISGAYITASEYSATTNSTGQYSFNVSTGVYNLNITKSGYEVWTGQVNASTADIYTVDVQLIPLPPQVYTLTITTSLGGTTDPSPGIHLYNEGANASVTAVHDVDYLFENWELDGSDVGDTNPYIVLMDGNHTIRAIFSPNPSTLVSIAVRVQDSSTQEPVSNATVYIKNGDWSSGIKYTDDTGWANFTGVENGTYLIVTSAEGYATANETASILTNAVYSIKLSRSMSSAAKVVSVPEFDLLIVTSIGAMCYLIIQRKIRKKTQGKTHTKHKKYP